MKEEVTKSHLFVWYHLLEMFRVYQTYWTLSRVQLFENPWTVAHQAPLYVGFPEQEYWSGLPFPSPGDLPDSGIEPTSPVTPALQTDSLPLSHQGSLEQANPQIKSKQVSRFQERVVDGMKNDFQWIQDLFEGDDNVLKL